MVQERKRAKDMNYPDPIQDNIEGAAGLAVCVLVAYQHLLFGPCRHARQLPPLRAQDA